MADLATLEAPAANEAALNFQNATDYSVRINVSSTGMTVGDAGWFTSNNASAKIIMEAEL